MQGAVVFFISIYLQIYQEIFQYFFLNCFIFDKIMVMCHVGAKLQATNRVPRPVDRGMATRYDG